MMRATLDACVLYPTILREILADVAGAGLYRPVWSARILEEWTRAAARLGADDADRARADAALLARRFPDAAVDGDEALVAGLDLPDPADRHVVATAIAGGCDLIVTLNLRDFPRRALAARGLRVSHPDPFLLDLWIDRPDPVARAVGTALSRARSLGASGLELRDMMKRSRLPRLGRAMARS